MARSGFSSTIRLSDLTNPFGTTAYPFTIATRFYTTSVAATETLVYFTNSAETNFFLLYISSATSKLRASAAAAGSANYSESGATVSTNTWHTGVAVYTSTTSRTVYLDATAGATDTVSRAPTLTQDRVLVGDQNGGVSWVGSIAEVAMWNVALTQDEITSYDKGFSPLLIRPQSLSAYWPIYGVTSPEPNLRNAADALSLVGAVASADHPRVYGVAS